MSGAARTTDEARLRVLEARAVALSRAPEVDDAGESVELVVLPAGRERYGVDIRRVQEIQTLRGLTPVPGAPACWAGVINLRGQLYPVLDLPRFLGLPGAGPAEPAAETARGQVVLVRSGDHAVALRTAEVAEVRRVPLAAILPTLEDALGPRVHLFRGVTSDLVMVLDVDALLGDPRLLVRDA